MRRCFVTLVTILACAVAACGGGMSGAPKPKTVTLSYDRGELMVEVAATAAARVQGLSDRDKLTTDGMIFDLQTTERPNFWMKGMRFPLDMIWIDENKRITEVTADVQTQPGATDAQLRLYAPQAAVRYVLETDAGEAASRGLTPGVQMTFALPAP